MASKKINGVGLGLRSPHIERILSSSANVPWFEILADNWLDASGIDGFLLDELVERYPMALHSVGMNIGGVDALNRDYLVKVKHLASRCQTGFISDHLCFSAADGRKIHDLLPLPYTEEALQHCCDRVSVIQDIIGCRISVENISAYAEYQHNSINEAVFLNKLAERTGCGILLDINNLYVNEKNLQQDAKQFIDSINADAVEEIHLGGFTDKGDYYLDAHNNPVCEGVWRLYEYALNRLPSCPTLVEWDNDLPVFDTLLEEQREAQSIYQTYSSGKRVRLTCA